MQKNMIKTLLQHGLILNPKDLDNPGLLSSAVEKGNLKIVEDLLKYREDINMLVDDYSTGLTPLHSAVKGKQVQMAKLLLNYGANVNVIDSERTSPIVNAIQNNDMEMTELLLTNGAYIKGDPVKYVPKNISSTYHFAKSLTLRCIYVDAEQVPMAKLLVNYGADFNVKDRMRTTPIVYAIRNNDTEMIELLLTNGADIKEHPKILCTAVEMATLKIVEDLIKYGADVNMLDNSDPLRRTPLHSAVNGKAIHKAKLLINYGANVNAKDRMRTTPIVYAIRNNDTEMIELLLTNGADIKKDPKVLCTAVEMATPKIVEDLLKHGADVNMADNSDFGDPMPLHSAVTNKKVQMAKLLINYGANVNAIDGWGRTPTAYAIQNRDTEMTELLVTNGVDVKNNSNLLYYTVLHPIDNDCDCGLKSCFEVCYDSRYRTRHARRCMQKIVKLLLSKGANVNAETESGITTLFAASRSGYEEIVGILLKYGAECDPGAEEDIKPLHAAAALGHSKIVENLLKFGAKVDSRDKYGRTALHFAFRGRYEQIVRTLLEYGSDVNIISIKNQTPLEYGRVVVDFANCNDDDFVYYMHHYNDWRYYANDSPSTKLLKQHIAKMKAAGLHISERNLLGISNDHGISNFLNECEAEIEIMKREKIDNSCVSFYDILTKNTSQLAKNKSIVKALKSNDYKTKFPIYASMIDSRFRRGVKREKLLEQVRKKFLYSLFGSLTELPLLCADKIFSYLSDKDLKILLV